MQTLILSKEQPSLVSHLIPILKELDPNHKLIEVAIDYTDSDGYHYLSLQLPDVFIENKDWEQRMKRVLYKLYPNGKIEINNHSIKPVRKRLQRALINAA